MFSKLFRKSPEKAPAENCGLRHIAFIMDGNGRWAEKRKMPRTYGHAVGAKVFKRVIEYCGSIGIEAVTVYAFSTENWKRPADEVSAIMKLFTDYLSEAERSFAKKDIQIHFLGSKSVFPEDVRKRMEALEKASESKRQILNIAVNYGGRDEIVHAARAFARDCAAGEKRSDALTEEMFSQYLYSNGLPDPELLIRPGGEKRISNYLLWQCAYSEFYFCDTLWPDFDEREFDKALIAYQHRERRFGGVKP